MKIGKNNYVTVAERVNEFRTNEIFDGWSMTTEILEHQDGFIMMKAVVKDKDDRVIADGIAYEINEAQGTNKINLTSYIENCQSSAWGRALGNLGIGSYDNIASADEVSNAIIQQASLGTRTVQKTHTEEASKTPQDFEEVWYDGNGPVKLYEFFMVGDYTFKCLANKSTGELFGMNQDKSVTGNDKFYKFEG